MDRASKASQGAGEGNSQRPPLPTFPLPAHNQLAHPALHPNVPSKPQNPETELFMHIAPCEARSEGAQGHRASRVQWGAGGKGRQGVFEVHLREGLVPNPCLSALFYCQSQVQWEWSDFPSFVTWCPTNRFSVPTYSSSLNELPFEGKGA